MSSNKIAPLNTSATSNMNIFSPLIKQNSQKYPLYSFKISAGFPSPADDYIEKHLDLNELLIHHPAATFFVRASGNSMIGAGIHDGDVLIVDRSLEPKDGSIVIVAINGELTVKRLKKTKNKVYLVPENQDFQPIEVKPENDVHIWGIVTNVIHPLS